MIKKIALMVIILPILAQTNSQNCTFKILNTTRPTFESLDARGTIGNLLIPLCTQEGDHDGSTQMACGKAPQDTLYSHPHEARTCKTTDGQYLYLQFKNVSTQCKSRAPQKTLDKAVILNYPEDFTCG